jgi:hypothetical protein
MVKALSSNPSTTKEKEEQCVPDVVVHTCNSSTEEAEVGEPEVQSQPGLHSGTLSQTNKQT